VGGLPDIIASGRNGVLVPPQQPGRLATALVEVLHDRKHAAEMTEAASATLQEYMIAPVAQRFVDLYELLLAEARGEAVISRG
jgi:glycosyltransferase involved in cell wall biosynthesis